MIARIVFALAVLSGISGWGYAFYATQNQDTLERRALSAEAEVARLSKSTGDLATLVDSYKRGDRAAELERVTKRLAAGQADLAALTNEMAAVLEKRAGLKNEVDAAQGKLDGLRSDISQFDVLIATEPKTLRTASRAKVREGPDTSFDEVAIIPSGIELPVFETVEDGTWHKVGYIGYVYHELFEEDEPASEN